MKGKLKNMCNEKVGCYLCFFFLIGCARVLCFDSVQPAIEETADLSSDHIMYVVRRLSPFTEYIFSVSATNIIGDGPSSQVTVKTTEQGKILSKILSNSVVINIIQWYKVTPVFSHSAKLCSERVLSESYLHLYPCYLGAAPQPQRQDNALRYVRTKSPHKPGITTDDGQHHCGAHR